MIVITKDFLAVQERSKNEINERGIIAVGNAESIEKVGRPHDELNILMTLKSDGTMEKTVVGSVVEYFKELAAGPGAVRDTLIKYVD